VHCHAGISRSATISISYIMKTMGWDLSKAYDFVKQKRPCISPNLHFMGQLLQFEKQLKEQRNQEVTGTIYSTTEDPQFPSQEVQPRLVSSPFHPIPLPKHLPSATEEQCGGFYCSNSSTLPSASAPSSLNSNKTEEDVPDALVKMDTLNSNKKTPPKPNSLPLFGCSQSLKRGSVTVCQVESPGKVEQQDSRRLWAAPPKPTSLPLSQVKPNLSRHTDTEGQQHRFLRQSSTPVQHTASLPTTPDNHLTNRTPSSSSSISSAGSSIRMAVHSLQNSPCRVVAMLGSRSESPLSFNNELSF